MRMKWSLYIGNPGGIRISIHWTFLILVAWIFFSQYQVGEDVIQGLRGVVFILALFACVTFHELGHAFAAQHFQIKTKSITLLPIGGLAQMEKLPEKPGQELWVAIAGPLVNVLIAMVLYGGLMALDKMPDLLDVDQMNNLTGANFWFNLLIANVVLAVFNLVPAFPMDGGRVLRALLSFKFKRKKATAIAAGIGQFLAMWFIFLGFFFNVWLVFIGVFIYLGAGAEAVFESTKSALEGRLVSDVLMTKFSRLRPNDTLGRASELLLDGQEKEFLVTMGDHVVGVLMVKELVRGLTMHGNEALVSSVMRKDYLILRPDMKLQDIYQDISSRECSVAPVIEGGNLIGMVDKENIDELILISGALTPNS